MAATIALILQQACLKINQFDARLLLQHVLKVNSAYLLTHSNQTLSLAQEKAYCQLVARRMRGKPIAYLLGECNFYDLKLKVTPDVLIPRPETELLVDLALKRMPAGKNLRILDLGTGSGAIALALARCRPQAQVIAVDLSVAAVAVAQQNARRYHLNNICIDSGHWFSELSGQRFDLIVSNPPYVAKNDPHLKKGDLRFEPKVALSTASADGLACIREITAAAPEHLVTGGWLLFEHGYDQAVACRKLLAASGFVEIFSYPDLAGIMRVSGGQYYY